MHEPCFKCEWGKCSWDYSDGLIARCFEECTLPDKDKPCAYTETLETVAFLEQTNRIWLFKYKKLIEDYNNTLDEMIGNLHKELEQENSKE